LTELPTHNRCVPAFLCLERRDVIMTLGQMGASAMKTNTQLQHDVLAELE